MAEANPATPTRGFWIVSILALLWNLIGIATYLMTVTITDEAIAAMPEAQRALYTDTPALITSAYAIAVFGGTLACVALLLRKAWAVPVFVVSLIGIVIQMGYAFFLTDMIAIQGAGAAGLPILIVVIAAFLVWYSISVKKKGWLQ